MGLQAYDLRYGKINSSAQIILNRQKSKIF